MMQSNVGGVPFEQCDIHALQYVVSGVAEMTGLVSAESIAISRAIAAHLLMERGISEPGALR